MANSNKKLPSIILPDDYNYIAIFLTMACNLKCAYCINQADGKRARFKLMRSQDWVAALNRIPARPDLPLSLQGGEPTIHPDFYQIINLVEKPMDLLTNGQFDFLDFANLVPMAKFRRNAPYAAIRISYHQGQMDLLTTVRQAVKLQDAGFQVGVWMIDHPDWDVAEARLAFEHEFIDFRTKELLGKVRLRDGTTKLFGTFKYPNAVGANRYQNVMCRTTELIVAPDGQVHRCHSDLYNNRKGIGHILDPKFQPDRKFRFCRYYGSCSGCDVKVKNNRFQKFGHTSCEILPIEGQEGQVLGDC